MPRSVSSGNTYTGTSGQPNAQLHPVAGDRRRKHVRNDMREVSTQKRAGLATSMDLLSEPPQPHSEKDRDHE